MKILICMPFPRRAPRGNSVAGRRLARAFAARGHEVRIWDRCESIPASASHRKPAAEALAFRCDVLLVLHAFRCANAVQLLAAIDLPPMVVSLRGTDHESLRQGAPEGVTARRIIEKASAVTVFSLTMAEDVGRSVPEVLGRVRVVPNGLDPLPRVSVRPRNHWELPPGAPLWISVAGIRRVKALPESLEAIASVREKTGAAIRYLHAGPQIEEEEATRFDAALSRHPWAKRLGPLSRTRLAALLSDASVLINASTSEGMPHAVREAMSVGLPCLLSDIAGHRLLAEPEREALFFADWKELRRQADRLLSDPALAHSIGQAARERIRREAAATDEIQAYMEIFNQIAKE